MLTHPTSTNPAELTPQFVPLSESLVASANRLSAKAGWNQTEEDWRRLSRVDPLGARVWVDAGEVRASYSVVGYGNTVAWIGMILADPEYRGRGLGKAAFAQSLSLSQAGGFSVIGLDATEMGEGIYSKFGFQRVCPIVRWRGKLRASGDGGQALEQGVSPGLLSLDRSCTGMDRSRLLIDLAESAEIFRLERGGTTVAFAGVRPGRTAWQIGPLVAFSQSDFEQLFCGLAPRLSGQEVICDVLCAESAEVLQAHGLQPSRTLQRMTLSGNEDCLRGKAVWFASGFEWG